MIKFRLRYRCNSLGLAVMAVENTPLSCIWRFISLTDVDTRDPNSVVIGLAPSMFHYDKLTEAFNLLKMGAELIAINKSRYFQSDDGLVLGSGTFRSIE